MRIQSLRSRSSTKNVEPTESMQKLTVVSLALYLYILATILGVILAVSTIVIAIWLPNTLEVMCLGLRESMRTLDTVFGEREERVLYSLIPEVRIRQRPIQRVLGLADVDVSTPAIGTLRLEITFFQLDSIKRTR